MKNLSTVLRQLAPITLVLTFGCSTSERAAVVRPLETVDTAPSQSTKGYVEFFALSKDAVIPIYLMDDQQHPSLLAATGPKKGSHYSPTRHPTAVAEKVRVAVPPGVHQFMVERDGQLLRVQVEPGKVTPVEVDYVVVEKVGSSVIYRLSSQVFEPVPVAESKAQSPKSKVKEG